MKIDHVHELPTIDGKVITLHLRNTMRQDVRDSAFSVKFADGQPDHVMRANFCFLWARVVKVEGFKRWALDESSTLEEFDAVYYGLSEMVHFKDFLAAANVVGTMKSNDSLVEKPDDDLDEVEAADPNS